MNQFLIIADDITGANDTGVMLVRNGMPTVVVLEMHRDNADLNVVLNTETRSLKSENAYDEILCFAKNIDFNQFDTIVKKVDSTLRGSITHEILAIDELYKPDLILFMPAIPDLGRTTQGGIHKLYGIPISQTEIGKDPKTPVQEDSLKKILQAVYDEKITHFNEADHLDFNNGRIFTSDACTNEHMKKVSEAAMATGKKILWVGASALVDNLLASKQRPALALVASVSETSRQQVKYAEESGIPLVIIPCETLLSEDYELHVRQAIEFLQKGKDVVVLPASTYDRTALEKTVNIPGSSTQIQIAMGKIAAAILEAADIAGIFLTGGDTAMGFFKEIGATRLDIISEVLVGIPLMKICGTRYDGLKVITKAGAFGQSDSLVFSMRKLKDALPILKTTLS